MKRPALDMQFKKLPDGRLAAYTTNEALGAWRNGTRIRKVFHEEGDGTPVGTLGTVLGSINHETLGFGYFVEWDDKPGMPVFVAHRAQTGEVRIVPVLPGD